MSKVSTPLEEDFTIKEQLYSLFYEITSQINGKEIEFNEDDYIDNIKSTKLTQIIGYLKETIHLFLNQQNELNKENDSSRYLDNKKSSTEQNEKMFRIYEKNEKKHLKRYFILKLQIDAYKTKLEEYVHMEREYIQMKEKFKYENGKFLENDRKDNEIIILRAENVNIKQAISELELKNSISQGDCAEKDQQIESLNELIEELRYKIENTQKELAFISKSNHAKSDRSHLQLSNKFNQIVQCVFCGSTIKNLSPNKIGNEQINFKMYDIPKLKSKQTKKFCFSTSLNDSTQNSNFNNEIHLSKPSSQVYINANKPHKHKHNGSLNIILENSQGDMFSKYINQKRLFNSNNSNTNIKITRAPLNQLQNQSINISNLTTKRDQLSPRIFLSKNALNIVKSKTLLNSSVTKEDN